MKLSYLQRKALRRLSRGQSISGRMQADSLIQRCYTWNVPPLPPLEGLDIVSYTDWEARVRSAKPRINNYGKKLLEQLENEKRKEQ